MEFRPTGYILSKGAGTALIPTYRPRRDVLHHSVAAKEQSAASAARQIGLATLWHGALQSSSDAELDCELELHLSGRCRRLGNGGLGGASLTTLRILCLAATYNSPGHVAPWRGLQLPSDTGTVWDRFLLFENRHVPPSPLDKQLSRRLNRCGDTSRTCGRSHSRRQLRLLTFPPPRPARPTLPTNNESALIDLASVLPVRHVVFHRSCDRCSTTLTSAAPRLDSRCAV